MLCTIYTMTLHLPPIIRLKLVVPERPKVLLRAKLIELLDLLGREFKSHGAQVIAHALLLAAGSNGHHILIHTPSQKNLTGVDGVLFA